MSKEFERRVVKSLDGIEKVLVDLVNEKKPEPEPVLRKMVRREGEYGYD